MPARARHAATQSILRSHIFHLRTRARSMATMQEAHSVYRMIIEVISLPSWKEADGRVESTLAAILSPKAACECKMQVKRLYLLFGMHSALPPESTYAKLDEALTSMRVLPFQLRIGVRTYFEGVIIYGIVDHVIEGDFALDVRSVPGLLDAYGWPNNKKRESMHALLSKVLRVFAAVYSACETEADGFAISNACEQAAKTLCGARPRSTRFSCPLRSSHASSRAACPFSAEDCNQPFTSVKSSAVWRQGRMSTQRSDFCAPHAVRAQLP